LKAALWAFQVAAAVAGKESSILLPIVTEFQSRARHPAHTRL
jgi:hypothetical protein